MYFYYVKAYSAGHHFLALPVRGGRGMCPRRLLLLRIRGAKIRKKCKPRHFFHLFLLRVWVGQALAGLMDAFLRAFLGGYGKNNIFASVKWLFIIFAYDNKAHCPSVGVLSGRIPFDDHRADFVEADSDKALHHVRYFETLFLSRVSEGIKHAGEAGLRGAGIGKPPGR